MDKLDSMLDTWKSRKNIEEIISGQFLSDADAIQSSLKKLQDEAKEEAIKIIEEIDRALRNHILDLKEEKDLIKNQIEMNSKNAKACISYGMAGSLHKDKNRS